MGKQPITSKKEQAAPAAENGKASRPGKAAKTASKTAAKKPAAKTASAASGKKRTARPPAAVAKPAGAKAAKAAPARARKEPPTVTSDDIALRAYFLAEKRRQLGLPGDPTQDWIEAERQLAAEARGEKPAASKSRS